MTAYLGMGGWIFRKLYTYIYLKKKKSESVKKGYTHTIGQYILKPVFRSIVNKSTLNQEYSINQS